MDVRGSNDNAMSDYDIWTTSPCVPKYRRTQRDNNEKKEEVEKLNAENQNVHSVRTLSASGCLLSGNVKIIINAIVHGHSTSRERAYKSAAIIIQELSPVCIWDISCHRFEV